MISIKYYLISLSIYLLEVSLIFFLEKIFPQDIISINFIVRIVSCIFAAYIYQKYLFKYTNNFYKKFLIIASIVPAFSTLLLLLLIKLIFFDLIILKIISDVLSSLLGYIILRIVIRN